MREFPPAALGGEAGYKYFGKHVTVCEFFAPNEGLHF